MQEVRFCDPVMSEAYNQAVNHLIAKLQAHKEILGDLKGMSLEFSIYDRAVEIDSLVRVLAKGTEDDLDYELSEYQCSSAIFLFLKANGWV